MKIRLLTLKYETSNSELQSQ